MSRLLEVLELIYLWQDDEVADLAQSLEERMKAAWIDTLRKLAQQHGCRRAAPNDPSREDLAGLRRLADEDAQSIANTWSRDVKRQLAKLYKQNPRGNRSYYIKNMEAWARKRGAWKNLQIGNATEQRASWFTKELFYSLNGLQAGKFRYSEPTPVGKECIKRKAAGIVDWDYARRNPTPAHPNCPHTWELVNPPKLKCDEMWLG